MEKKFIKSIEKELDKKIDLSKSFEENDMDSLDIMTFISIFEDYYKIKIKANSFNYNGVPETNYFIGIRKEQDVYENKDKISQSKL